LFSLAEKNHLRAEFDGTSIHCSLQAFGREAADYFTISYPFQNKNTENTTHVI
jgi:hypothetical protein